MLRKVLAVVTLLACVPPLLLGALAVADRGAELGLLGIADTPDTRRLGLYFGLAALGVGLTGTVAAGWVARGRREGAVLAALVGASMAFGGLVMLVGGDPFAALDLGKGALVVGLAVAVLLGERPAVARVPAA